MPNLRNGSNGDSNPGSLDCESGVLTLSYRAPVTCTSSSIDVTLLHEYLKRDTSLGYSSGRRSRNNVFNRIQG